MPSSFIKNSKERKECSVLSERTEKNAKKVLFLRTFRSFIKNGKESKKRSFLYKNENERKERCVLL